jgi:predicted phosphodiesterase
MRLGLIADIHGNLVALEAALAALASARVDQIVCLGDAAASGPQPQAVLERLRDLGCPVVMGNADAALVGREPFLAGAMQRFGDIDRWCAAQLSPGARVFVESFPPTVSVPLGGGRTLLAFHGSPRSFNEQLLATTPDATLRECFADHPAALWAGGHTHLQLLRRVGASLLVNPGSVGLAYDRTPDAEDARLAPWAEYAVLDVGEVALEISLRRAPFDRAALQERILASGMPHAAWWASLWD